MTPELAHVGGLQLVPLQLAPLLITAVGYELRLRTLSREASGRRVVPGWRRACFHTGLALIAIALASPLGHMAEELFWAHMAEHLLLADAGALLVVLGLTGPVLQPILRVPELRWLRHAGHPGVAFGLWVANLAAWHVPALHEAAVEHEALHALQHLGFVATASAVWLALFGPLPKPAWFGNGARLGLILAVRLTGAILANTFLFGGDAFYDVYDQDGFGLDAQADQQAAGAVMMVWESILTICLFGWLFFKTAKEADERQELLDLARREGLELTEQRAARAVAAGRGAELRERLRAQARG